MIVQVDVILFVIKYVQGVTTMYGSFKAINTESLSTLELNRIRRIKMS